MLCVVLAGVFRYYDKLLLRDVLSGTSEGCLGIMRGRGADGVVKVKESREDEKCAASEDRSVVGIVVVALWKARRMQG